MVMLLRHTEPDELMNGVEQAHAYAHADFAAAHEALLDCMQRLLPDFPVAAEVIDLGCGAADITIRLLRRYPQCSVLAVDGAQAMLKHAKNAVGSAGLQDKVTLRCCVLPAATLPLQHFDAVVSNSLLHHLYQPEVLWQTILATAKRGACIFVSDLRRPKSIAAAKDLTARHAAQEPEIVQKDFYNSLLAAFTPDEVRMQLQAAALNHLTVTTVSDRHIAVYGKV